MNQRIRDALCEMCHEEAVILDGPDFDEAIVGVTDENRVIYDYDKMVLCLEREHGISQIDAEDFIGYNTIRAIPYAGEKAPIIMYPIAPLLPVVGFPANTATELLEQILVLFQENNALTIAEAIDIATRESSAICPHCRRKLIPSTTAGYTWQCLECDEDFYSIEAKETP